MKKLTQTILLGILTALLFSSFIYLEHYGITNKLVNTLTGLGSLALFLYIPKRSILVAGFTIGLLWFYWIGYSFEYQGVGYMTPIITFAFGVIYLLFFLPLYFTNKAYIRALLLFGLSFVEPFDWNWLQIELLFVDSYIGVYKYQLAFTLVALSSIQLLQKPYRFVPLLLLIVSFNYGYPVQDKAPLKIKLVQTDVKQEYKWTREALHPTVDMIFKEIANATKDGYDLVVLPESVFPLYMNQNRELIERIKYASEDISIIVGALLREDMKSYNVTYLFQNREY
ncbi:MAG: apolipoprotein N-acyltransferase, partial [Campylobacterota bacterium]|nr:apolipoprotein N-acyltransferase [Campylobacterota bacterium]